MKAIIKKIYRGGLIVDVGGKEGRIPRRELNWNDPYFNPVGNFKENDIIEVVPYETFESDQKQFSLKRADYDPWKSHHQKYQTAIDKNNPLIARGIITDIIQKYGYVVLEDFNDALFLWEGVFPRGIED